MQSEVAVHESYYRERKNGRVNENKKGQVKGSIYQDMKNVTSVGKKS
jgi:hypothetical protein